MGGYILVLPVLLPVLSGALLSVLRFKDRKGLCRYVFGALAVSLAVLFYIVCQGSSLSLELFAIADGLDIYFQVDAVSKIFALLEAVVWLLASLAAFEYMEHERDEQMFFGFFLAVDGILCGLGFCGNLLTFYLFFELMTLTSVPLVLHSMQPEAVEAGLKYLFYSIGGAFMVLFGLFFFACQGVELVFTPKGVLGNIPRTPFSLLAVFLMILGFGTKAGMFPMHGWLPAAHPVAPAPASAVLSGVITKAGVLGIVRSVFYIAGADFIRGTWVQYTWIGLALVTVLMGSMLAYQEKGLKKRLAYSTVSQVSYVLFGLSLLNPAAFVAAMTHVVFHSIAKDGLFLCAGAVICKTEKTQVAELRGIGKQMPVVLWCFLAAALTLIGIPPTSAFVSKWYLALGSLAGNTPVISWLGPAILLVSAILTAGYLLPIAINGFLPGSDFDSGSLPKKEPTWRMLLPVAAFAVLSVVLGIYPAGLMNLLSEVALAVL